MKLPKASLSSLYYRSPAFRPSKADVRRISILETALELVTHGGVASLSIQSIAHKLRMRRSHVSYYYPDVEPLLVDLMGMMLSIGQDITVAHLSSIKNPVDMLDGYVEATFLWFRMYPNHAGALFLGCHLATVSTEQRKSLTFMCESAEARIVEILSQRSSKKKRSKAWLQQRASDIRSLIMGNLLNYFTTSSRRSYDTVLQQTIQAVRDLANAN